MKDARSAYRAELEAWRQDEWLEATTIQVDRVASWHDYLISVEPAVLQTASYFRLHARFRAAEWTLGPVLLLQ